MNIILQSWCNKIDRLIKKIDSIPNIIKYGHIVRIAGSIVQAVGLKLSINSICIIEYYNGVEIIDVECIVVRFSQKITFLALFDLQYNILPGSRIFAKYHGVYVQKWPFGIQLLGHILDSQGNSLDNQTIHNVDCYQPLNNNFINPMCRKPIHQIFDVGVRAINALLTLGKGQKIGLLSQSGYGKSVLIGMISKYSQSDIVIIGLIGERGREVQEFIKKSLGKKGLSRSIIVAIPSNSSPILKIQGAMYAIQLAEYFRDQQKDVLFILDSLTRYAMAEREIDLLIGEIPVNQGYSPSIISKLSNFIERVGNTGSNFGTITALYTILLENEEHDFIAEVAKSILDGHIVLSKLYADSGHYPAIDIELSISRIMVDIVSTENYKKARYLKKLITEYQRSRDLINVGAYVHGSNITLDEALKKWDAIESFLKQDIFEASTYKNSIENLNKIV